MIVPLRQQNRWLEGQKAEYLNQKAVAGVKGGVRDQHSCDTLLPVLLP